ncbi:phosphocholine-specific phospholipase C [Solitalea lacus]|uniref:phosphocholine-specific phospholipase C n=1 Tax=Solitalea lacus TaxID=2911172 RepID=UPI001EDAE2E9|nr:phospholipase C, phosphocholine-specific [Solitalea lacus]UKJ07325.1 phospholipase C, phosphocholine-specific [Solitalea lacus]
MDTRREFIKKAAMLSGAAGIFSVLPPSIQKALAIDPKAGSTFMDAEHVVLLMQENRSFDHCFGSLKGVRGFNDPRAITLPDKNLVWFQKDQKGRTYVPFRMDIKASKATWMSSLPHSWGDQVDARNDGKYDQWLVAKQSGNYPDIPMTLGYYNREDIPFYYALADAFTVCDQHFCSSLTGTTPNRLYFWTGTIRDKQNTGAKANVWNSDVDYDKEANWTTFPERLEEHGVSWKVYQNEISVGAGFDDDEDVWLANFTDNPIEWFSQYNVRFSAVHINYLKKRIIQLPGEIEVMEAKISSLLGKEAEAAKKKLEQKKVSLIKAKETITKYNSDEFEKLSQKQKNLHEKAFVTNSGDPDYHQLLTLNYDEAGTKRQMKVPKGDVLHQFREDVKNGKLPTVSWLVAPQHFSDHPSSPWFGAWYLSEVMDILAQNPEVWKKTIFILTYDENDGSFDHIPPFVAPDPARPESGATSKGIDASVDYVTKDQELRDGRSEKYARQSPIGLGYRIPFIVASPWTRGGWVNSEVFDHTSTLQFLEEFLSNKTGKKIEETNISSWRRAVCGDLTSVFRPYNGEKIDLPASVEKEPFLESINNSQFKDVPKGFKQLTAVEIAQGNKNPLSTDFMPRQEKGVKASCSLPYQLYAGGKLSKDKKSFELQFAAKTDVFGPKSAGAPFNVYAPGKYRSLKNQGFDTVQTWAFAAKAGEFLNYSWLLNNFENENYFLRVYGPNGFFREFKGNSSDPEIEIIADYNPNRFNTKKLTGNIDLKISNLDNKRKYKVFIIDNAYKQKEKVQVVDAAGSFKGKALITIDLSNSHGWYDFSVKIEGFDTFEQRYAGRVETGQGSYSDPAMGMLV